MSDKQNIDEPARIAVGLGFIMNKMCNLHFTII